MTAATAPSPANAGTALITGASSGIGAVYADRLAKRGYSLVLVARDEARLHTLAKQLTARYGVAAEPLVADLTDDNDIARVVQRIDTDAALTLLLNNAGMAVAGDFLSADTAAIDKMIRLNTIAPTRLAQAAGRVFARASRGTLINVASVLALAPERSNGAYNATKAHILALSQSLAATLTPMGVRVQAVLPGLTRTEIFERSGGSVDNLPAQMVMDAGAMVDAALAGLDQGETVTIPSLQDGALWQAFEAARAALGPHLSRNTPAARYQTE